MLTSRVLGQEKAVSSVVRALTIAAAGIRERDRPIASLLFVGPTGVGKTELARQLAVAVGGSPDDLCRVDMSSLAQEHYSASLTGAPPGYAGAKERYTLFDRERIEGNHSRPGIVLFDEVEKAHTTVLRTLLQILDTGVLHLNSGNDIISFRNAIIILTSNLGTEQHRSSSAIDRLLSRCGGLTNHFTRLHSRHTAGDGRDPVLSAVENFFDPELFNRFDEVIRFNALTYDVSRQIVDTELSRLQQRLAAQRIEWIPSTEIRDIIVRSGFDETYGARNLKRCLRTHLYAPVAASIVSLSPGCRYRMTTRIAGDDRILVNAVPLSDNAGQ